MADEIIDNRVLELPVRLLKPVKITQSSSVRGIHWPDRRNLSPSLIVEWDDKPYAIYLSGDNDFRYFPVRIGLSLTGVLVETPEFIVDVSSRYNSTKLHDPLGSLVIVEGKAYLVGLPIGEAFAEPVFVPVWGEYDAGTADEAIGFTRWSIIVRDGDHMIELWRNESPDPG